MEIREFDSKLDLKDFNLWWAKWNPKEEISQVPREVLPAIGRTVVGSEGQNIAMGFVYQSNSKICWLEWLVVNPDSNPGLRREALDILISELKNVARDLGFWMAFTSVNHGGLISRLEGHGFEIADKNMTNMIGKLV